MILLPFKCIFFNFSERPLEHVKHFVCTIIAVFNVLKNLYTYIIVSFKKPSKNWFMTQRLHSIAQYAHYERWQQAVLLTNHLCNYIGRLHVKYLKIKNSIEWLLAQDPSHLIILDVKLYKKIILMSSKIFLRNELEIMNLGLISGKTE